MSRRMSTSNAWLRAVSMHAHLAANGRIKPLSLPVDIPPAMLPERNELAVGIFDGGMTFERYYATEVRYDSGGPTYVTGSQQFVAGYLLAELALGGHRRRRARREAALQWRPTRLLRVVVTNRRLWCQVVGSTRLRWMNFNYDTITGLTLTPSHAGLTLSFLNSEPLRLTGEWVPWCAAVIAHYRYGPDAAAVLPALNSGEMTT
jgi:hypothetical protein